MGKFAFLEEMVTFPKVMKLRKQIQLKTSDLMTSYQRLVAKNINIFTLTGR